MGITWKQIRRTPEFDDRVVAPRRSMLLVVDLFKNEEEE